MSVVLTQQQQPLSFSSSEPQSPYEQQQQQQQQPIVIVDFMPVGLLKPPAHGIPRLVSEDNATQMTSPTALLEDEEEEEDYELQSHASMRSFAGAASLTHADGKDLSVSEEEEEDEEEAPAVDTACPLARTFTQPRRRSSILKPYDTVPVSQKRGSWLQLPKCPLSRALSAQCTKSKSTAAATKQSNTRVSFCQVHVRRYSQTLGDNPSVSYGPPISLDWDYEVQEAVDMDVYEATRGRRRNLRQMMLNYYHRKNLLTWGCGATEADMEAAQKAVNKIKRERALTRALLPASKLQEVWQSAGRKAKRMSSGTKKAVLPVE